MQSKVKLHNFFTIDIEDVKSKKVDTVKAENRVILNNLIQVLGDASNTKPFDRFFLYNTVDDGVTDGKSASARLGEITASAIEKVDENTVKINYSYVLPTTANNGLTIAAIGLGNSKSPSNSITRANLQDSSGGPIQIVKDETMIITLTATVYLTIELAEGVYRPELIRDPIIYLVLGYGFYRFTAFASARRLTGRYGTLMPISGALFGLEAVKDGTKVEMTLTLAAEHVSNGSDIQSLCICASERYSYGDGDYLWDNSAETPGNYVLSLNSMDCVSDTNVPLPRMKDKQYKLPAYYLQEDKLTVKKNGVILEAGQYTINKEWIEPILIKSVRDDGAPMCMNDNYFHVEKPEKTSRWFAAPITDDLSFSCAFWAGSGYSPNAVNGSYDMYGKNTLESHNVRQVYLSKGKELVSQALVRDETNSSNLPIQFFRGTGETNSHMYYCMHAAYGYIQLVQINSLTNSITETWLATITNYRTYATNLVSPTGKYYLRGYDGVSDSSALYKMTGNPLGTGDFKSWSTYSRPNISKMTKIIKFHPSNDELLYNSAAYDYFMYHVESDTWYNRSYIDLNMKLELGSGHPQIVAYSTAELTEETGRETIKVYLDFNPLEDIERAKECFCMPCDSTHMRFQYPEFYQGAWRTVSRKLVKVGNEWIPERPIGFLGIQAGVQNDPEHSYWMYDTLGKSDAYSGKVEERLIPSSVTVPDATETDVITVDYTLNYIPKDINRKVTIKQSIEFVPAI